MKKSKKLLTVACALLALTAMSAATFAGCGESAGEGTSVSTPAPKTVTVTFDLAGGTGSVATKDFQEGDLLNASSKPTDPTKENYVFEGWFYADNTAAFAGEAISDSVTVYAKWAIVTKTVTFDLDGGTSEVASKAYDFGAVLNADAKPADPTKQGFVFKGWFYEDDTAAFAGETISADVTVYAKWEAEKTSVVLDGSVFSLMNDNADTYEKVGDNYVYTKYTSKIATGDMKLDTDTTKWEGLFVEGNWLVIKLNSSVGTWLVLDGEGLWTYLGYNTDFTATSNKKTPEGEGYAIYQIGSGDGIMGDHFWSSAQGSADAPVVFTIESVGVYTPAAYAELEASIKEEAAKPKKVVLDGSVFSLMNDNADTYEKVGDNYVYTKYTSKITTGDMQLDTDTTKWEGLFVEGNWLVIKLNSSVGTWLVLDGEGLWTYLGYNTDFTATSNSKTPQGEGYAIYQIGSGDGIMGDHFWSSAQGSEDAPVVFTIESVGVYTQAEYEKLVASAA